MSETLAGLWYLWSYGFLVFGFTVQLIWKKVSWYQRGALLSFHYVTAWYYKFCVPALMRLQQCNLSQIRECILILTNFSDACFQWNVEQNATACAAINGSINKKSQLLDDSSVNSKPDLVLVTLILNVCFESVKYWLKWPENRKYQLLFV